MFASIFSTVVSIFKEVVLTVAGIVATYLINRGMQAVQF